MTMVDLEIISSHDLFEGFGCLAEVTFETMKYITIKQ
jgi:hypothetical protein